MSAAIRAMHYCLPKERLNNATLEERFGTKALDSIVNMAGIHERRIVTPGVTAADLAYVAAQGLLADCHIDLHSIDLLVFTSQTPDYQIPATACVLHGRLGLSKTCAAFDLNLGCSAFPYTLSVAEGMIAAGRARRALILNADALTTVIHPQDRALVPLQGDGAAATLVEISESSIGVQGTVLGTDGSGHQHLIIPASGARCPRSGETRRELRDDNGSIRTREHLSMNGPAIFHFCVYQIPEAIEDALAQWDTDLEAVDLVIFHQANKTMLELIYQKLKIPSHKRFFFMATVGNLSGASVPVTIAEAWRQGKIKPGSLTLLAAFGVGLSWGITLLRWPDPLPPPVAVSTEYLTT